MTLSEATRLFPGGELTQGAYQADLSSEVFARVIFFPTSQGQSDLVVSMVIFGAKNGSPNLLTAALREFGDLPHRSEMLGTRVVWPNVAGYELAVTKDSYIVALRN
jgi:hypothetical protein